jgi:hypothetical protein
LSVPHVPLGFPLWTTGSGQIAHPGGQTALGIEAGSLTALRRSDRMTLHNTFVAYFDRAPRGPAYTTPTAYRMAPTTSVTLHAASTSQLFP